MRKSSAPTKDIGATRWPAFLPSVGRLIDAKGRELPFVAPHAIGQSGTLDAG
jgi:hypothetical protein